jgi:hypothetical protein
MIEDFYEIDRHPLDRAPVLAGLMPLLSDDAHGQVSVIRDPDTTATPSGHAVITPPVSCFHLIKVRKRCDQLLVDRVRCGTSRSEM